MGNHIRQFRTMNPIHQHPHSALRPRWLSSTTAAADNNTKKSTDISATTTTKAPSSELDLNLTPSQVVAGLDRHIVGQHDAKRAVAIAMRNRWRRKQLSEELRKEVTPRNVLLVGPTGCGKTEGAWVQLCVCILSCVLCVCVYVHSVASWF